MKITKENLLSILVTVIVIPATLLFGMYFFNDRKYYFISILVILELFIPFCMTFEKRRPNVRELVIISVMTAIAVAGRCAFYNIPQFQIMTAIIMISGIVLGAETGFLVGAMSGFVSNFFLGQGSWTPWQMFAWGLMGFLAGVIFKKIKAMPIVLTVFGFVAVVILYGPIMNIQTALSMMPIPDKDTVISCLTLGLPFDLIHGASTAAFMLIAGNPMISALDRIKTKYGI